MTDSSEELKRTIYVTNISNEAPWKTNLTDIFEVFGEVTSIDYIQPRNNNREWQPTGPALIETLDVYCMLHIFSYLTLSELILCEYEVVPSSVTSFTITTADIYQPEVLDIAARAMPNLQEINERSGPDNSDDEGLFKLLTAFPKVTQLGMELSDRPFKWSLDWTNVQKLTLILGQDDGSNVVPSLIDKIGSNLKELFWRETFMGMVDVALNCPQLKKFVFRGHFSIGARKALIDFSGAPNLEELSICKELVHCKLGRENMLLNCTKIKKLQLQPDDELDAPLHFLLFHNWPKLTHLDINYTILPGMMEELIKLKELEKLSMRGTGSVYEHELVNLIDALSKLKHLDVSGVEILDKDGSKIKDIEPLCNRCLSDGRPDLELYIFRCGLDEKERLRWRCGRFILYNPKNLDYLL
ncbi:uncharacterized protein [Watersipora subatra]|uniref:uncharacterized protein isoform X2 n=1 Tax=Watersipora subatra TaxID=2589382 RepID=UPI00355C8BD2